MRQLAWRLRGASRSYLRPAFATALAGLAIVPAGAAAAADPPAPLLATGDSMIQYIDSAVDRRLRTRVISDARISTGISKPLQLDWPRHAATQVRRWRPAATAVFLGANDGFSMPTPDGPLASCCGRPWRIEYARRVQAMVRTYGRDGAAHVYWLTLPQARAGFFRRVYPAVNAALRRAARALPDEVELVKLDEVFTPGGRYRDELRWRGRLVRVRQADGIHLSPEGAEIAASILVRQLRADGLD